MLYDVGIQTTAKVDGDDLVINGGKMWTTNGAQVSFNLSINTNEIALPLCHLRPRYFGYYRC